MAVFDKALIVLPDYRQKLFDFLDCYPFPSGNHLGNRQFRDLTESSPLTTCTPYLPNTSFVRDLLATCGL